MINCAKKAVRLTTSSGKEVEYVAENLVMDKATSNRIVLNHLDAASTLDIRTVSEFPVVFPEELPDMPPDYEIEFVIELVPGTLMKTCSRRARPPVICLWQDDVFSTA
jgi:hypothetical protein